MPLDANKIVELQNAVVETEAIAKQLVNDPHHGKSQFVAPIRGALTHAMELIAEHKLWLEKNPTPTPTPPAATN